MPNWCENSLNVSGDKESLDLFIKAISGDDEIDFTKLVPRPTEEEDNWYNWNCDNWGTKWAPSDIYVDDIASFSFLSAWGPPIELFTAIAKLFPTLDFSLAYSESGMCFCGAACWVNGELAGDAHISDYTADPRYKKLVADKLETGDDAFYDDICALENTIRDECLDEATK